MHYNDMTDLEDWAQKYEKAVADGVFGEPDEDYKPTPKTSQDSFFGASDRHPTEDIIGDDAKYWQQINARAEDPNYQISKDGGLIQETRKAAAAVQSMDSGAASTSSYKGYEHIIGKLVKSAGLPPNPVRLHSLGTDQEITPSTQGLTFTPEDVDNLAEMKKKLHSLQDDLNSFEARGKNSKKFEGQILSLKEKIDELSTAMCQTFPFSVSDSD